MDEYHINRDSNWNLVVGILAIYSVALLTNYVHDNS